MSDPKEPTVRLSSCRGGGRCPECGEGSAFPFRLLCGCSPCLSSACSLNHTRALLTEALRQLHMQELCAFDANGHADAAIKDMEALREERDAAIRENVAADQRGWERAISAVRFALADYPHAGLDSEIGAQVERIVAKKTESAIRERDEAREQAQKHDPFMRLERAALSERADRVEALLRECQQYMGGLGLGRRGQALLAKIREALQ